MFVICFFFNDTATTEIYTLSLHDALPISKLTAWGGTDYNFAGWKTASGGAANSLDTTGAGTQNIDTLGYAEATFAGANMGFDLYQGGSGPVIDDKNDSLRDTNPWIGAYEKAGCSPPTIIITDSTNILCYGDSSGTATVTPSGGTTPYTYLWDDPNSQTDSTATGLMAGTYSVLVTDAANCGDSTTVSISNPTPLSGIYTIGGILPDYTNFTSAVTDLICKGVSGTVTFNVRDGAPYNEQIEIPAISGASATNAIMFQSENGDSALVTLTFAANITNNYTVKLNNASYITFKKITIQATDAMYGRVFDIMGGSSNNKLLNNRIIGITTSSTATMRALVFSGTGIDNNNEFRNNLLINGSTGIYLRGINAFNLESGNVLEGNTFSNQYYSGINTDYQLFPKIISNVLYTNSISSSYAAIDCEYCDDSLRILKNVLETSTAGGWGLYLRYCDATVTNRGLVANNSLQLGNTSASTGIYTFGCDYLDIYHNSVNITGTNTNYGAFECYSNGSNVNVVNNIFANSGGGYAAVVELTTVITTMDNNDLYTTGAVLGNYNYIDRATLASWQAASGKDANSVSVDPLFLSVADLHLTPP